MPPNPPLASPPAVSCAPSVRPDDPGGATDAAPAGAPACLCIGTPPAGLLPAGLLPADATQAARTAETARARARVQAALRWLRAHAAEHPDLARLAEAQSLSPAHLQRLFTRWVGVSPKRYVGALTADRARALLTQGAPVLETALAVGLSGPSRLHDLYLGHEGVSPGADSRQGAGLVLRHGLHATPFGPALVLVSAEGLCGLSFVEPGGPLPDGAAALAEARHRWPRATWIADDETTGRVLAQALAAYFGLVPPPGPPLVVSGTRFQVAVWRALLAVPTGTVVSYQDLARAIGCPQAVRAVGTAVGRNPIAVVIPCHRVIRADGGLGGYRYGLARKTALLAWELEAETEADAGADAGAG